MRLIDRHPALDHRLSPDHNNLSISQRTGLVVHVVRSRSSSDRSHRTAGRRNNSNRQEDYQ